ncbi:MAG: hypothetical protein E6415_14380 [Intestinibacter bartlettii]|jgi:hypothetical protein|uniref:hypothetical protein n=1 Tax=Intestinibacter bartlettii TaxID=261299 RepID=UPI0028FDE262|nr:hypothetical protein [Intestinibacter bartlettii]MDU0937438.1 hypothetical protein [Dermabacter sp.]MDU1476633.1 hypothetical protein [Clostridium perfringens]MDU6824474.1 hypothetical protein [Intestinibacter bartlettii]
MNKFDIDESLRMAEGNIKHEGMYLIDEERELIKLKAIGKLTKKEFINKLIELHTNRRKECVEIVDDIDKENNTYKINEEKIFEPES